MKKTLLLLLSVIALSLNAQVVVKGIGPSSIAGVNYDFTWADPTGGGWSTPDFNQPNTFVQDTLELVVDNSLTGNNPAYAIPHPLANEGCLDANGLQYDQVSLAGKIAVVWRGSCQFGLKAALAENNGAVGIIIINHTGAPVGMAGGDSGMSLNIPVVMISVNDGQSLLAEMANGPVEIFMGNKLGANANDVGSSKDVANISKYGSIPIAMANNGYSFDVGLTVTNFGSDDNTPILEQSITGPSGEIYSDSLNLGLMQPYASVDTLYQLFTGAQFTAGEYSLQYNLSIDSEVDADMGDNMIESSFNVTNNVLSLARTDENTGELITNYYPRNATTDYSSCMMLQDVYPTASTGIEGVYFSLDKADSTVGSEYLEVQVFEWNDPWTNVGGAWANITFNDLNPVKVHDYICPDDSLNNKMIYSQFDAPVTLTDNQRYLVCLQTFNPELAFGYDNGVNYGSNFAYYDQPIGALNIDLANWYSGWSAADAPSLGLKIVEVVDNTGINENNSIEGILYPNPTKSAFNLNLSNVEGKAEVSIHDLSGRIVKNISVNEIQSRNSFNINELSNGHYYVRVVLENGKSSNFNMVINK
jgi:hypothetical protein